MPRSINLLVVHCSASANGDSLFRGEPGKPGFQTAATAIDGWHKARGFERTHPDSKFWNPTLRHIGYHFVVACNGAVFTGRSLDEPGAHAVGFNAESIGICLTGTSRFTEIQFQKLASILRSLNAQFGIQLRPAMRSREPRARLGYVMAHGVAGHRDLSPDRNGNGLIEPFEYLKTCPGFDVAAYLESGLTPSTADLCDEVTA